MSKKPVLVLFFMTGCPHCAANQKAWDEAKKSMKGKAEIEEHEASEPETASEGVNSFPTMKLKQDGHVAVVEGAQPSGTILLTRLTSQLPRSRKRKHRGGALGASPGVGVGSSVTVPFATT
jgi:glutaredoxin